MDGHKVYVGNWLNVHVSEDESIVGTLRTVAQIRSTNQIVLRMNRYEPDDDCTVTELPTLKRRGEYTFDVELKPGVEVEVVCVTFFKKVYRWNINVPPLKIKI